MNWDDTITLLAIKRYVAYQNLMAGSSSSSEAAFLTKITARQVIANELKKIGIPKNKIHIYQEDALKEIEKHCVFLRRLDEFEKPKYIFYNNDSYIDTTYEMVKNAIEIEIPENADKTKVLECFHSTACVTTEHLSLPEKKRKRRKFFVKRINKYRSSINKETIFLVFFTIILPLCFALDIPDFIIAMIVGGICIAIFLYQIEWI